MLRLLLQERNIDYTEDLDEDLDESDDEDYVPDPMDELDAAYDSANDSFFDDDEDDDELPDYDDTETYGTHDLSSLGLALVVSWIKIILSTK